MQTFNERVRIFIHEKSSWIIFITLGMILLGMGAIIFGLGRLQEVAVIVQQPFVMLQNARVDNDGRLLYRPYEDEICPGDAVVWQPEMIVPQDVEVQVWRTIKKDDGDGHLTEVYELIREFRMLEAGEHYLDNRFMETEELIPGQYYVLIAIGAGSIRGVRYRVPFTIRDDC